MPTYFDISVPIHPTMLIWPGDPAVELNQSTGQYVGRTITTSEIHLGSHTGTHVDAPLHFGAGPGTVDQLPLDALCGPAQVLDLRGTLEITADALRTAGAGRAPRVLLRTDNSTWIRTGPWTDRPAHLTKDGAEFLCDRGLVLVGIDGLTVDLPGQAGAHVALLEAGIVILETLELSAVEAGDYELLCLSLRLQGADGSPARAVLRRG